MFGLTVTSVHSNRDVLDSWRARLKVEREFSEPDPRLLGLVQLGLLLPAASPWAA